MELADTVLRKAILGAAESTALQRLVRRGGLRLGAGRFVAGETLDQAVPVHRRLNGQGLRTNTTLLGEGVRDEAEARAVVEVYAAVLARIQAEGLRTNVSLKLTHIGLALGEEVAYRNLLELVETAARLDNFVRIDMEDAATVDATLRLFRRVREAGRRNVGAVLQAYLYRTPADLDGLLELKPNLRLVKGAYLEPQDVAYPHKRDVDEAYGRLAEQMLTSIPFTAIATHDERLIQRTIEFATREGVPPDRFQFQLLYGVRPRLQLELAARGYDVLVATPYGPDWYRYLMRRLAERPANLLFLLRSLVRG